MGSDGGLQIFDLRDYPAFANRPLHARDIDKQTIGLKRLSQTVSEDPERILQQLVEDAIDLCGADSAGMSLERHRGDGESYFEWVATAGAYKHFLNALLPRYPSPCGTTLDRDWPQLFRAGQDFFQELGVQARTITDGLLLPWRAGQTHGTFWILAHGRPNAFDAEDLALMQIFASVAAMGLIRHGVEDAQAVSVNPGGQKLALQVDFALGTLQEIIQNAAKGEGGGDAKSLAVAISKPLQDFSILLEKLFGPLTTKEPN